MNQNRKLHQYEIEVDSQDEEEFYAAERAKNASNAMEDVAVASGAETVKSKVVRRKGRGFSSQPVPASGVRFDTFRGEATGNAQRCKPFRSFY